MKSRSGVTLVEVIVAMTLLAVILTSLASVTFQAARRTSVVAAEGYRQGVLVQELNRVTALPWANLPGIAGCTTVSGGTFPHTRCIAVTTVSNTIRRVRLIVTPAQPRVRPDTVIFDRANPPAGNPLSIS
ncbi:MAG: type IV pilus modification PilV family protein [Longimicrobiales bacterium]